MAATGIEQLKEGSQNFKESDLREGLSAMVSYVKKT